MDKIVYELFGFERTWKRDKDKQAFQANPANKYLIRLYTRLYAHAKMADKAKFDKLAKYALKHSVALRLVSLYRVEPTWYKDKSWADIARAWERLIHICRKESTYLVVRKVEIPKSDGSMRPLGVPNLAFRIYMNMQYTLLSIWIRDMQSSWQHGFRPWHGVGTAWADVLHNVVDSKFIYEFDLRKFFDSIDHKALKMAMEEYGVPDTLKNWILKSTARVAKRKEQAWRYSWKEAWLLFKASLISRLEYAPTYLYQTFTYLLDKYVARVRAIPWEKDAPSSIDVLSRDGRGQMHKGNYVYSDCKAYRERLPVCRGVPQGCNMSPTLATLTLEMFVRHVFPQPRKASLVMYADDGIIFGDDQFYVERLVSQFQNCVELCGSKIHPKKSGWIRRNGEPMSEFKFLGLRYLPGDQFVRGDTRKGSTQKIPVTDISRWNFEGWESGSRFVKDYTDMSPGRLWHKYKLLNYLVAYCYNRGLLSSEASRTEAALWKLRVNPKSFFAKFEHELVRKCDKSIATDLYNLSTHATRLFQYKIDKYQGHVSARSSKLVRMSAKNRHRDKKRTNS